MAATAAIAAGVIGAGGSIAGGALSQPDQVNPKTSYYNPFADPVLAGLSNEAMLGLGLPSSMILEQASPINQLINRINMDPTLSDAKKRASVGSIVNVFGGQIGDQEISGKGGFLGIFANANLTLTGNQRKSLERALREAGLPPQDLESLLAKEAEWRSYTSNLLDQQGELLPGILGGRLSTQSAIGNLMGELGQQFGGVDALPGATAGGYMRNLEADINRTYDKQLEDVMRLANTTGFNPGRAVADLEDSRASALRNLGHQGALQGGQILAMLQGSLQPAQDLAANTAGIRTGQGVSTSGAAGNQATALTSIQAQLEQQRSQALGAGTAGAFNNIGNSILLSSLLSGGPGSGGGGGGGGASGVNPAVIGAGLESIFGP